MCVCEVQNTTGGEKVVGTANYKNPLGKVFFGVFLVERVGWEFQVESL